MSEQQEKIYDSPPEQLDDDFWLEQGKKMVEDSMPAVREAAKALMTGLGLLKAIYLGILGFADYVPKEMNLGLKSLFLAPMAFWLGALYFSVEAIIPKRATLILQSPDDIRRTSQAQLRAKEESLEWSFRLLAIGLFAALALMLVRLGVK